MKKKPTTEPMLTVTLGNQIYLSGDVKDSVIDALKQRLIMDNPIWIAERIDVGTIREIFHGS